MGMHAKATLNFTMNTDAPTDEAFIQAAEDLSFLRWGEGLDSWDCGDALGAFLRAAHEDYYSEEGLFPYMMDGFSVTMDISWDTFRWGEDA